MGIETRRVSRSPGAISDPAGRTSCSLYISTSCSSISLAGVSAAESSCGAPPACAIAAGRSGGRPPAGGVSASMARTDSWCGGVPCDCQRSRAMTRNEVRVDGSDRTVSA